MSIVEHVAGVDDFEVVEATYRAAVARWPRARITLRQGIRAVHDIRMILASGGLLAWWRRRKKTA